jgi:hypothetical protein
MFSKGRINNYDCNSRGVGIEINCYRSTWEARMNFEENFSKVYEDVYIYTYWGNLDGEYYEDVEYYSFYSYGYCQGDRVKILINLKEYEKIIGIKPDIEELKRVIHNYLWDLPLIFELSINGIDYESNSYGSYDIFDRDKEIPQIMEWARRTFTDIDFEYLQNQLEYLLPLTDEDLAYI